MELFFSHRNTSTALTKEATAIDMLQPIALKKKGPAKVEGIGSQDFVVTLSTPPPPYRATESKLDSENSETKQKDAHQRRKKTRRKRKAEMPPLNEENDEDEECLLLHLQGSHLEGGAVVTLIPEGSHDLSCDLSPSSSCDEESSVSTDQVVNSSRELYSENKNIVAKSQTSPH